MLFNIEFTQELFAEGATRGESIDESLANRQLTIGAAFTENKRWRRNPEAIADMVNRNAAFVYQTDALLNLILRS